MSCFGQLSLHLHNTCQCVVPKIIHTSPTEGISPYTPHPSGNSSQASYIYLNFGAFESLPPPRNFQSLPWGEYGYFLELHNKTKFSIEYYHMTYLLKRSLATEVTNFATCIGQWCAKL